MMKKIPSLLVLTLLSGFGWASSDPIEWQVLASLPSPVYVNVLGEYKAIYRFTNRIPLKMVSPLIIKKITNSPSEFQFVDNCSGKQLDYGQSCLLEVYLNPTSAGTKSFELTEIYGYDEVPLPGQSTTATGGSGSALVVGSVPQALTNPLILNSPSPWEIVFTNESNLPVTGANVSVAGTSNYTTNCGLNLAPHHHCSVKGEYTPTAPGSVTISANYAYTQGATVNEQTSSSTSSSGEGSLSCKPSVPFAPQILKGSVNNVTLLCTNKSGSSISIDNTTSGATGNLQGGTVVYPENLSDNFPTSTNSDNNCANPPTATLANNASCQLNVRYTAANVDATGVNIGLTVNYTANGHSYSASTSTSTEVVTTINNSRIVHLHNLCNFPVWWGMVGGAVTGASAANCPAGSIANNGRCLYNGTAPSSGSYELAANGGTATTKIIQTPASTLADSVLWKGLISGQTRCAAGSSCANNDCGSNGGTTQCTLGFQQPATEAEFTFLLSGAGNVDTYDITQVNGFSIPMSMSSNQTADGYTCGNAGSVTAEGGLRAADYTNVSPPTQMYYWVSNLGSCTDSNTCTNTGQKCGITFDPNTNAFAKACGDFLGYWSANQICQTSPDFSSPFGDGFSCTTGLGSPFPTGTYTLTQLLKCSPPNSAQPLFNSCYLSYSGASAQSLQQCCGCSNWEGIANPSATCPSGQVDSQWTNKVHDLIAWMKTANPTGYSYPYDDKASTFQCTAAAATEYTVTFCPGNQTGLPSGLDDGRRTLG